MKENETLYGVVLIVPRGPKPARFEVHECVFQDGYMRSRVGIIDHSMFSNIECICYESDIAITKQNLIAAYRKDISSRLDRLKELYDKTLGEIEEC